jgi:hypothetical protein
MKILHGASKGGKRKRWQSRWMILFLGMVSVGILLWAAFGNTLLKKELRGPGLNGIAIAEALRTQLPDFMRGTASQHGIIFVVDPTDFSCPPCFEDLQRICDETDALMKQRTDHRRAFLVRQSASGFWSDSASVRRWGDAQGFSFPIVMVPETTYAALGLTNTSVIVVTTSLSIVRLERVPMSMQAHREILSLVEG